MSRREYQENKLRKNAIAFSITLIITIIAFILIFSLYNRKLREDAEQSILELGSVNAVVPNSSITEITNPASGTSDKGINDVKNQSKAENKVSNQNNKIKKQNETIENTVDNSAKEQNTVNESSIVENEQLQFMAPVIGEITKDFANDTLVYSKTLDEWTTHSGIDIKAEKTSIVVSAEVGVVESIKNDPRYGLTVTITHREGFKTIYSNLLSTEFITEGELVERGQTIATVGESSSFEIADETHLHFEMIKDGEYVNPTIYLK